MARSDNTKKTQLTLDEVQAVESALATLRDAWVYVSVANGLDQDRDWAERITVLLDNADRATTVALSRLRRALRLVGARWKENEES